jgi:tetratricopeptide (TPR) repeat protein/TolB-like protein
MQRHTALAVGILTLSLAGARVHGPLAAQQAREPQQRGGNPNPDTPQILVAVFQGSDHALAVETTNETRKRIQQEHSAKELYAVPKGSIDNTLKASGYQPDSALSVSDVMVLSKQVHGDYVLDGTVSKTGSGLRLAARLLTQTGQQTLAQPLPAVDGKDPGDLAKGVERHVSDALKSMPSYKTCTNDLRAQKYDEAAQVARAGITAYPNSTLDRLCLLTAFSYSKAAPDSIIAVSNAILTLDPTSTLALSNAADAYAAKGDNSKSIEYNLRIYKADPTNTVVANSIVGQLVRSGAPDTALPILDSLLVQNPGDPNMLRTKWHLQLAAKRFKDALVSGEEYVKAVPDSANLDYFNRQIGAAQSDSNAAAVQQLAARASQKFPKEVAFPLLLTQSYYKAGQLQQALMSAKQASAIDPKNANAAIFQIVIYNQMNQSDSALAAARAAIAGGVPKDSSFSQAVIAIAGPALQKAKASNSRADWEAALRAAQTVDSVAPSPQTKYYVGVSAFQVGIDAVQNVQAIAKTKKPDKAQACAENKVAEDMFATASIAMPPAAQFDKATAGQIMGAIQQYGDFVTSVKKAYSCK